MKHLAMTAFVLALASPVAADVNVGPNGDVFAAGAESNQPVAIQQGANHVPPVVHPIVVTESCAHHVVCNDVTCQQGQTELLAYTPSGHPPVAGPICVGHATTSISQVAQSAFRRIPVPTPALHIQPVKGRTLVNLRTDFYATGGAEFTRTVNLLGHRVTLRVHVDHYVFRFGDGEQLTTAEAGDPYPRLTNTHTYRRRAVVHPDLTTTWAADYRVGGGAWRPVPGTVTTTTPPQRLEVVTATPVLVTP